MPVPALKALAIQSPRFPASYSLPKAPKREIPPSCDYTGMSKTTVRGFATTPTNSPDYESGNALTAHDANFTTIDAMFGQEVHSAAGAIGIKEGYVFITASSGVALTLAAPTAGAPASGGDDGKELRILSTTAQAHTVTTPSNKLNGSHTTATYGTAVGNCCVLVAYNGVWYAAEATGVTIS